MQRLRFLLVTVLLLTCSCVSIVFANPGPVDPWDFLRLRSLEYMAIGIAEFCGVVAGTFALTHNTRTRWLKAAVVVLLASLASYFLGVALWTWSYNSGILFHEGLRTIKCDCLLPTGAHRHSNRLYNNSYVGKGRMESIHNCDGYCHGREFYGGIHSESFASSMSL
jgi:hypothetical protein